MAHHYYGSSAYGWAAYDNKQEVIKALARDVGTEALKRMRKNGKGLTAVICRVDLPQKAHYSISNYMPNTITKEDGVNEERKGELVPIREVEKIYIMTMAGRTEPRDD